MLRPLKDLKIIYLVEDLTGRLKSRCRNQICTVYPASLFFFGIAFPVCLKQRIINLLKLAGNFSENIQN